MKKSRRKSHTGNPAKRRRGRQSHAPRGPPDDGPDTLLRWIGREVRAFLNLPEWLAMLILLLLAAAGLRLWRWLAASAPP